MGASNTREDYHWSYTDEPHASRRKEILKKYPQIKELYGFDPRTKYIVTFWLITQLFLAFLLKNASFGNIKQIFSNLNIYNYFLGWVLLAAYGYGAIATQALFLAMHEISHNLAFKSGFHNKIFGCIANLGTVIPHFS